MNGIIVMLKDVISWKVGKEEVIGGKNLIRRIKYGLKKQRVNGKRNYLAKKR